MRGWEIVEESGGQTVNNSDPADSEMEQGAIANGELLLGRGTGPTPSPPPQSIDSVAPEFTPPVEAFPSELIYKLASPGAGSQYQACRASLRVGNIPLSALIDTGASATVISKSAWRKVRHLCPPLETTNDVDHHRGT
jgi:hypothetical protein